MKKLCFILLLSTIISHLPCSTAQAYDHDGYGHDGYDHGWHDHDIHRFHEYDVERWHHGYWLQRFHDGRNGWWWVVDGQWYFYPAPVYPYPDPYTPPMIVAQPAAGPQYWYCANPPGYYPYVPQCAVQWQSVPAGAAQQPVVAPPPAPMPAPAPAPQSSSQFPMNQRDVDDRQLNSFAVELSGITADEPGVIKHIRDLQKRVETFRQSLFQRSYNAMDILKDAENLQKRISKRKTELLK